MTVTVTPQQSILDIALQYSGSIEAAYDLASLNHCALTDDLYAGEQLTLPSVLDARTVQHYTTHRILPATGITSEEIEQIKIGGIGYWIIEQNFIIS